MTETFRIILIAMGIGRIAIGLAPFVAAELTSRLLGFPQEHDSPTARLMARFFGVRDIGLGVLAIYATAHPESAKFLILFNAAMDGGDLFSTLIPIVKKQGITKGAALSASMAVIGGLAWLVVYALIK